MQLQEGEPSMRGARAPMPDIAVDLPPCAHAAKQIPIPALADRPEPVFEGDSSSDSASDVDAPRLPDEPAVRQTSSEKSQHEPEPTLVPLPSGADASPPQTSDGGSVASWQCVAEDKGQTSPIVDEADEYIFLFNPFSKVVHVARSCDLDDPLCQYVPVTISSLDKPLKTGCGLRGRSFGWLAPEVGVCATWSSLVS